MPIVALLCLLFSLAAIDESIIETVAGGGSFNNVAISEVPFTTAAYVFDTGGILYFADSAANTIRKAIVPTGKAIVFAGGTQGLSPDGGPATQMWSPTSLTFDRQGNLIYVDSENHRVRKIDPSGKVSTIAGSKGAGIAETASGDGGLATQAVLTLPSRALIDLAGNIYISDVFGGSFRCDRHHSHARRPHARHLLSLGIR